MDLELFLSLKQVLGEVWNFLLCPGRLLNVLCTFNLRTVSAGQLITLYAVAGVEFQNTCNHN